MKDESDLFPFLECEVGDDTVAGALQRHGSTQAEINARSLEAGAIFAHLHLVATAGVIECRTTLEMKRKRAADDAHSADQLIRHGPRPGHGHEILHFAHAVGVQEARYEDVGVRPVELLVPKVV